jgi:parvulin-like peptidyl-prolyl isomerase
MRRVCLVAVLALAQAACAKSCDGNDQPPTQVDSGHRTSATLTPEQTKLVLAKVGDRTITLGDFAAAIENMDQFDRLRYQSPERRKELLDEMINVELLANEAKAKGYDKDPLSDQEIRAILRDAMLVEAHKGVPLPNDVPEAEVHAYFDAHRADFKDPERRRLSLIVLKSEAQAKEALASAKKATTAADWGALVRQLSADSQAQAKVPIDLAGDFGIVSPPGDTRGENARVPAEVRARCSTAS